MYKINHAEIRELRGKVEALPSDYEVLDWELQERGVLVSPFGNMKHKCRHEHRSFQHSTY